MKKMKTIRTSTWLLIATSTFLPSMMGKSVEAANPTIAVRESGYNATKNEVTIQVTSNGTITMPGGNKHSKTATLVVNKNGVYSFEAQVGDHIVTESINVTKINKDKLRTNNANVKLKLNYKDELSGIHQVRLKNESGGTWNAWQSTASVTTNGSQTVGWKLDDRQEGDRAVYVQFRDQAGNITPGQAYDKIIYDVSGPTFAINSHKYYVRENTFKLDINDLKDTYSPIAKVSIKVGNQPFKDYKMDANFLKAMQGGLEVEVPAAERNASGVKKIQVKAEDDLGNVSAIRTIDIYHDNKAPNKGNITLNKSDNTPVKTYEGGRMWNEAMKDYVYYSASDGIRLVDDKNIRIQMNLGDQHSGVAPDTQKGGYARVDVIEYNINTDNKRNVIDSSRKEVRRKSYTTEIKPDGSVNIPWQLAYGLEKQMAIVVYDNAGNSKTFYDEPIYMSALNLVHFKVKDVVNPRAPWTEVAYSDASTTPGSMMAGGNVEFEIMYNLLTAQDPTRIFGSLEVTITDGKDYHEVLTVPLEQKDIIRDQKRSPYPFFGVRDDNPDAGLFTLPDDAPIGAKVYANGWLKAEFKDNSPLRIYFPTKELILDKEIGVISGNLHNEIQFRSVQ